MSGIVNSTGARSGVIGTTVGSVTAASLSGVLPVGVTGGSGLDAPDADQWYNFMNTPEDYNSNHIIDFHDTTLGANVTESGGTVTVATAGWYFMYTNMSKEGSTADTTEIWVRKNGTAMLHRLYYGSISSLSFSGESSVWIIEAAATNTFELYGTGNLHGNSSATNEMTYFGGWRMGS